MVLVDDNNCCIPLVIAMLMVSLVVSLIGSFTSSGEFIALGTGIVAISVFVFVFEEFIINDK